MAPTPFQKEVRHRNLETSQKDCFRPEVLSTGVHGARFGVRHHPNAAQPAAGQRWWKVHVLVKRRSTVSDILRTSFYNRDYEDL